MARKRKTSLPRFVAFESRYNGMIFVPDPELRGRYLLTDRCVALIPCPQCEVEVNIPCNGSEGPNAGTHWMRRSAAYGMKLGGQHDVTEKGEEP